jgi:hypothetical protein
MYVSFVLPNAPGTLGHSFVSLSYLSSLVLKFSVLLAPVEILGLVLRLAGSWSASRGWIGGQTELLWTWVCARSDPRPVSLSIDAVVVLTSLIPADPGSSDACALHLLGCN